MDFKERGTSRSLKRQWKFTNRPTLTQAEHFSYHFSAGCTILSV